MSPTPIDLTSRFDALGFLPDRTPDDTRQAAGDGDPPWVGTLADYRDGGIFIVHYAGESEWELHPADEIVMVVDGATTITLVIDSERHLVPLTSMQLVVVPAKTWHRFDTPDSVRVMTVTPQPTQHRLEDPADLSESLK